ncbi:hypothetical protein BLNAU_22279 [Blattamonas nauphoetae]|uniref:Uncharacterized protein n=1 Tax=Blattamonas nauphoetae TaxID=2049346 RepID=A0ABQ9WTG9_9EUKA|nr:hypothetical protein BLNAU_22279 [Blattamonas nauphoetae]
MDSLPPLRTVDELFRQMRGRLTSPGDLFKQLQSQQFCTTIVPTEIINQTFTTVYNFNGNQLFLTIQVPPRIPIPSQLLEINRPVSIVVKPYNDNSDFSAFHITFELVEVTSSHTAPTFPNITQTLFSSHWAHQDLTIDATIGSGNPQNYDSNFKPYLCDGYLEFKLQTILTQFTVPAGRIIINTLPISLDLIQTNVNNNLRPHSLTLNRMSPLNNNHHQSSLINTRNPHSLTLNHSQPPFSHPQPYVPPQQQSSPIQSHQDSQPPFSQPPYSNPPSLPQHIQQQQPYQQQPYQPQPQPQSYPPQFNQPDPRYQQQPQYQPQQPLFQAPPQPLFQAPQVQRQPAVQQSYQFTQHPVIQPTQQYQQTPAMQQVQLPQQSYQQNPVLSQSSQQSLVPPPSQLNVPVMTSTALASSSQSITMQPVQPQNQPLQTFTQLPPAQPPQFNRATLPTPQITQAALPTPQITQAALPTPQITQVALPTPQITQVALPTPQITQVALPTPQITSAPVAPPQTTLAQTSTLTELNFDDEIKAGYRDDEGHPIRHAVYLRGHPGKFFNKSMITDFIRDNQMNPITFATCDVTDIIDDEVAEKQRALASAYFIQFPARVGATR